MNRTPGPGVPTAAVMGPHAPVEAAAGANPVAADLPIEPPAALGAAEAASAGMALYRPPVQTPLASPMRPALHFHSALKRYATCCLAIRLCRNAT